MATTVVEIKHRITGAVLFSCEVPDSVASGLTLRHAMERATESRADLRGADLRGADLHGADLRGAYLRDAYLGDADLHGADLRGADLHGADLRGAYLRDAYLRGADLGGAYLGGADLRGAASPEEAVANLDRVREIILDNEARLEMSLWHGDDSWKDRTCVEETLCGTTHCLAGWLQVCSTDPKIRDLNNTQIAGTMAAPVAASMFFAEGKETIEWLRDRKYAVDVSEAA